MRFILLLWKAQNNRLIFEQKWTQNISFERVSEDNTRWAGCTNIHIVVYYNIVFASYSFSVPDKNNKIFNKEWLQRTTPDGPGALASIIPIPTRSS